MAPEINLVDPDFYQRRGVPHGQFAWLRAHAPVYWHANGGADGWPGFWAVTRHRDLAYISRHPEIYSSARRLVVFGESSDQAVEMQRLMMLNMDPPQHTRQRRFVNRGFTPRMIGRLEEHVTQICHALIDGVARRGEADFVTDIAAPLPLQVICELVGAPLQDRDRIFELSNALAGFDDPEYRPEASDGMRAAAELYAYGSSLAERRREQPDDALPRPGELGKVAVHDRHVARTLRDGVREVRGQRRQAQRDQHGKGDQRPSARGGVERARADADDPELDQLGRAPDHGVRRVSPASCWGCSPRSAPITCITALISARCVNACGKLPRWRPVWESISSA